MFWKNWSLSQWILSVVALFFVTIILFPIFARPREIGHPALCSSNLKQLGLGIIQYTQDFDGKGPLVALDGHLKAPGSPAYGWGDAIYPYVKSPQIYQCPQENSSGQSDPTVNDYTDYYFNSKLGGNDFNRISKPERFIVLSDGNDGKEVTDARYAKSMIPPAWFDDTNSPLYRHAEASNYLFTDRHVKTITPDVLKSQLQSGVLVY